MTSPSADPITPGARQGSHWSAKFEVTGMTRPGKIPSQARFEPRIFRSRGGRLNHKANEAVYLYRHLHISHINISTPGQQQAMDVGAGRVALKQVAFGIVKWDCTCACAHTHTNLHINKYHKFWTTNHNFFLIISLHQSATNCGIGGILTPRSLCSAQ